MNAIRRILIVAPPRLTISSAVERGIAVAKTLGARVWIGRFERSSRLRSRVRMKSALDLRGFRNEVEARFGMAVQLVDDPRPSIADRIPVQVAALAIDLVVKDAEPQSALKRIIILPLDWVVARECPVPLWLVNGTSAPLPRLLMAAVDATHPEHGAGRLNDAILDMARTLKDAMQSKLRVSTVFSDVPYEHLNKDSSGLGAGFHRPPPLTPLREQHRDMFDELLRCHGLSPDEGEVLFGPPREKLGKEIRVRSPDVLIIGTFRRQGFERLFLGSTAEHLMARAHCDTLIVPMPSSARRARRRTLGPRNVQPKAGFVTTARSPKDVACSKA